MDEANGADTDNVKGEGPRARGSGTESVYKALRHEILTMERAPGSPLDETRLSEHFGMSRTPIREALLRLT
ncbi:MAG: GntR family transcriptional regulator, partial [Allorhizobium sp.]